MTDGPWTFEPDFATCSDCGGQLVFGIWAEGVDSHIECTECGNKRIIR